MERWNLVVPQRFQVNIDAGILDSASAAIWERIDLEVPKQNAKKLIRSSVQTGKKAAEEGQNLVKGMLQSDQWKSLKRTVKQWFVRFFRLLAKTDPDEHEPHPQGERQGGDNL
jgi:hypothetical protein